jgi:hypothetical protein
LRLCLRCHGEDDLAGVTLCVAGRSHGFERIAPVRIGRERGLASMPLSCRTSSSESSP